MSNGTAYHAEYESRISDARERLAAAVRATGADPSIDEWRWDFPAVSVKWERELGTGSVGIAFADWDDSIEVTSSVVTVHDRLWPRRRKMDRATDPQARFTAAQVEEALDEAVSRVTGVDLRLVGTRR